MEKAQYLERLEQATMSEISSIMDEANNDSDLSLDELTGIQDEYDMIISEDSVNRAEGKASGWEGDYLTDDELGLTQM